MTGAAQMVYEGDSHICRRQLKRVVFLTLWTTLL